VWKLKSIRICHIEETEKCTMPLVEIVANNAKFHLSHDKISQFTVVTASRNINHKTEVAEDLVAEEALAAEVAEDLVAEEALAAEVDLTEDHEKCTRQLVEIVVRNVKFHSSQKETSQSIVANVFKVIKEIKNNITSCFIRS
jgi:hypothetical protein